MRARGAPVTGINTFANAINEVKAKLDAKSTDADDSAGVFMLAELFKSDMTEKEIRDELVTVVIAGVPTALDSTERARARALQTPCHPSNALPTPCARHTRASPARDHGQCDDLALLRTWQAPRSAGAAA